MSSRSWSWKARLSAGASPAVVVAGHISHAQAVAGEQPIAAQGLDATVSGGGAPPGDRVLVGEEADGEVLVRVDGALKSLHFEEAVGLAQQRSYTLGLAQVLLPDVRAVGVEPELEDHRYRGRRVVGLAHGIDVSEKHFGPDRSVDR